MPLPLSAPEPPFLPLPFHVLPPKSHLGWLWPGLPAVVVFLASDLPLAFLFTSSMEQPELPLKPATTSCCSPDTLSHPLIYFLHGTHDIL